VRGRAKIACEAGPLAPWLKGLLETQLREVVVCDRRRTRLAARGGPKTDKFDADRLSECLRTGSVHPIHVPDGAHAEIRRYLLHYVRLVRDQRRIYQRIKALFLESGLRVRAARTASGASSIRRLPRGAARDVARAYFKQLETTKELVAGAKSLLIQAASSDPAFALLQTIPQIGQIRAATLLGIVGSADRFGARRKFWSYAGWV
jgi:transposase